MTKINFADILFIILAAILLVALNELGQSAWISRFSFLLIYGAYLIGRLVGTRSSR